jgi:uncharacterized membrane protein YhaH (DUF805 family)
MNLGKLLFSFEGRINRGKFWLAVLIYIVAAMVAGILAYASNSEAAGGLLNGLVSLVTFISGIFVAIKRLHDRNRSGWWLLLFYIAPGILIAIGAVIWLVGIAGESSGAGGIGTVFVLAGAAISIWAFVELGCLRGTVGPNQYGPDPLEQAPAPVPAR